MTSILFMINFVCGSKEINDTYLICLYNLLRTFIYAEDSYLVYKYRRPTLSANEITSKSR